MCRCLLVVVLVFSLSRASPLEVPPVPAPVDTARDTEHEESTVVSPYTGRPSAGLGPEVPDMMSGVTVNQTFLHKVDSDNVEPGDVVAPIPELSTHRNLPDHETNLTDKVDSPRVLDPGTTHQEDSSNNTSQVLKVENITRKDSTNISQTVQPVVDVNGVLPAVPEIQTKITNKTTYTSSSASNKTEEDAATTTSSSTTTTTTSTLPLVKKTGEDDNQKPVINNTKALLENLTQPPPPASRTEEVEPNPTNTQAPVKNETKPQLPVGGPVEVFAPSRLNESQNLLAGYQPQTSEQHADHLQMSGTADPSFLQPSQSAAILAGVFVVVALLGYVGLLVWRRLLEKKYGNREMLVNEDEFYDTSDLRHFEL